MTPIGRIAEITRYPVKSMAGVAMQSAEVGWYGIAGDRRFAFRRVTDRGGFPFLSASHLPALLLYHPIEFDDGAEMVPTHVRTPEGARVALDSAELQGELSARFGKPVELMRIRHGVFDETPISLISLTTIAGIGRAAGVELDRRRFRANIILETDGDATFLEDQWVGGTVAFGNSNNGPAIRVVMRDERCMMINLDPDTAIQDGRIMKTVVRMNGNMAGVYANVIRTGTIRVGDPVTLLS